MGGTYQNPQNQCTALKQTKITSKFSNSILRKVPSGHEKNRLHNILRCGRQMMRFRRRRFPCITSSRFCHQLAGPFGHGIHILLNTREFDSPLRTVLTKISPNQVQTDDGRPTNSISHIRSRLPDSKSKLNQPAQECDYRAVIHTGERERVQSVYGAEKGLF